MLNAVSINCNGSAISTLKNTDANRLYEVTFVNYDGTVLQQSGFEYGATPEYAGKTPEKPSSIQYSYTFSGWSPSIEPVKGSVVYRAEFSATVEQYVITLQTDDDGGGFTTGGGTYKYGESVTIKAVPDKDFAFEYWNTGERDSVMTIVVKGNATYIAHFHTQNADNTEACSDVASVNKYDRLLMLNVEALTSEGYSFSNTDVEWYLVIGEQDRLSDPESEHDDWFIGSGYYYTIDRSVEEGSRYYGVVILPEQSTKVGCTGIMRTKTYTIITPASLKASLSPSIVAPGGSITISDLPDEDVMIFVYDNAGKLYDNFNSNGCVEIQLNARYDSGNYIILLKTKDYEQTLKYIVR